jgi:hypothetical protein
MALRGDIERRIRDPDQYEAPALAHFIATRSSRELPDHVDIEEQVRAHGELIAALHRAILDLANEIEQLRERD